LQEKILRYTFGMEEHALRIEHAVQHVLASGPRTPDIWREGKEKTGTVGMGDALVAALSMQ
jgi:3-isopropylmalate dehydrogenase